MNRIFMPFHAVPSTAPSFNSTLASTSSGYQLESTGSTGRAWNGPGGRALRVASIAADDYYVSFATASSLALASTDGMLFNGGVAEAFHLSPKWTHIAFKSSTDVVVNVTLGYGG